MAMPYMAPLVYVSICLVQLCIVLENRDDYGPWPEISFIIYYKAGRQEAPLDKYNQEYQNEFEP